MRGAVLGARRQQEPLARDPQRRLPRAEGRRANTSPSASRRAGSSALVAELRAAGYRYLNVTIPHKAAAAALADRQGPEVRVSGAANTLLFGKDGRVRAENTDGAGLLAALADLGVAGARRDGGDGGRGRRRRRRARGAHPRGRPRPPARPPPGDRARACARACPRAAARGSPSPPGTAPR